MMMAEGKQLVVSAELEMVHPMIGKVLSEMFFASCEKLKQLDLVLGHEQVEHYCAN